MKVTKDQVMTLCETVHQLKRLGDQHAKSEDWERETFASCELANSTMNNMTSVDGTVDTRTRIAINLLQTELAHERTRTKLEEQQLTDAVSRSVYLADALLSQLAQTDEEQDRDRIVSEDSRKYWQGRNNELKARIVTLEDCVRTAWGIIANVSRGNWNEQNQEWQEAAIQWRDRYVTAAARLWQNGGAR